MQRSWWHHVGDGLHVRHRTTHAVFRHFPTDPAWVVCTHMHLADFTWSVSWVGRSQQSAPTCNSICISSLFRWCRAIWDPLPRILTLPPSICCLSHSDLRDCGSSGASSRDCGSSGGHGVEGGARARGKQRKATSTVDGCGNTKVEKDLTKNLRSTSKRDS